MKNEQGKKPERPFWHWRTFFHGDRMSGLWFRFGLMEPAFLRLQIAGKGYIRECGKEDQYYIPGVPF